MLLDAGADIDDDPGMGMKKVIGLNSAGVMLAADEFQAGHMKAQHMVLQTGMGMYQWGEELQQHQEQDKKIARQAVHNPKILSHLQGFHNSQAVEK